MNIDTNKYTFTETWYLGSEIRHGLLYFVSKTEKYNILEIGSFEGLSACGFSDNLMSHPDSTLDCVDPFILSGTNEKITTKCVTANTEKYFRFNIENSQNANKITFHKLTSDDFFINNNKTFNLIYIDGCHEPDFIKNDMENSFACLEKNGIMWMDDYGGNTSKDGKIAQYMDIFLEKYKGKYQIIYKNYQLAIRKL